MSIIAMGSGGGLNNTQLRKADAATDDVLKGKRFYSGDKTLKTGTLELTGNAGTGDVLAGVTFYNTNAKSKQTGTLELTGSAYADDVLMGRTFYNTNAKTKVTGALELTGSATANYVVSGKTFYNTNAKAKITGAIPNLATPLTYGGNAKTYLNTEHQNVGVSVDPNEAYWITENGDGVRRLCIRPPWGVFGGESGTLGTDGYVGISASKLGNATQANVLEGVTFSAKDFDSLGVTGTMPNRGAWTTNASPGDTVTIPAGYHNGSGKVNISNKYVGFAHIQFSGESGTTLISKSIDVGHTIQAIQGGTVLYWQRNWWEGDPLVQRFADVLKIDISYSGSLLTAVAHIGNNKSWNELSFYTMYLYY